LPAVKVQGTQYITIDEEEKPGRNSIFANIRENCVPTPFFQYRDDGVPLVIITEEHWINEGNISA
jgi:hypothetical protein